MSVGKRILAIDEGTTGVTALVLEGHHVLGRAYAEVPQTYPRAGWVEQDPRLLLEAVKSVGRQALRAAKTPPSQVAAVGLANQRETTVLWDRRTGFPVAPAIVWQDRRTAKRCEGLQGEWASHVARRTGLVLDSYFCATKLEWLLAQRGIRARARRGDLAFGTIDSWLAFHLTKEPVHVTDPTNASRTLLWDIHRGDWDSDLLDLFGVPAEVLPDVVASSGIIGNTQAFGGDLPVASLVGDQQAALFGQGCTRAGEAKATYGTGAFLLQHTGPQGVRSRHGLVTTRAAAATARPEFALEGSVFTAGAAIQWLRDQIGMVQRAAEVDALAAEVPDAGGVHLVPAFTGLGAPHWDPKARGAVFGLGRGTDRRHLARAVLDAIALQAAEVLGAMQKDSGHVLPRLRVDGGVARSDVLLQIQADLLQRPVVRPANLETTALGAGMLAALAVDAMTLREVRARQPGDRAVRPRISDLDARRRMGAWRRAVAATRNYAASV